MGVWPEPRRRHCCHELPGSLSPGHSAFVGAATRSHCGVLCFMHISTSLAQTEFSFISSINTFHLKKSCVFPVVPETLCIASRKGFGPQPTRHICRFRSPVPSRPPQPPRWWKETICVFKLGVLFLSSLCSFVHSDCKIIKLRLSLLPCYSFCFFYLLFSSSFHALFLLVKDFNILFCLFVFLLLSVF